MICKQCQERNFKKILKEADEAMKRYTRKLKEERKECLAKAKQKVITTKEN